MRICRSLSALIVVCLVFPATGASASIDSAKGQLAGGELNEALESLDSMGSDDLEVRFLRGVVLAELGRDGDAEGLFRDLISEYPDHPEPYNNLAVLLAGSGRYDEAVETLKSALRTHPSYRTAWDNLTTIYGRLASEAYSRALNVETQTQSSPVKLALLGTLTGLGSETSVPAETMQVAMVEEEAAPEAAESAASSPPAEGEADESAWDSVTPAEPLSAETQVPVDMPADEVAEETIQEMEETAEGSAGTSGEVVEAEMETVDPVEEDAVLEETAASPAELSALIEAWAAAWSGQRVDDYLSFYSRTFETNEDMGLEEWKALRRSRIQGPEFIRVSVALLDFAIGTDEASVTFNQSYESNTFSDLVTKTLDLVREDGLWKIVRETVTP